MEFNRLKKISIDIKKPKLLTHGVNYSLRIATFTVAILIGLGIDSTQASEFKDNTVQEIEQTVVSTENLAVDTEQTVENTDYVETDIIIVENTSKVHKNTSESTIEIDSEIKSIAVEQEEVAIEPTVEEQDTEVVTEPTHEIEYIDSYTMFTTQSLNLRSGPSTDYDILTSVGINTELKVIGTCDSWRLVDYKDNEYFCSGKYLSTERTEVVKTEPSPYDNYIIGEDGVQSDIIKYANDYWNKNVPNNIKEFVVNNAWKIIVSAQPLKDRFGYSYSIAGLTSDTEHAVYLDSRKSAINTSMVHEIGHVIDYSLDYYPICSLRDEFVEIYNEECNNFVDVTGSPDYARSSSLEYFASVFSNIVLSPASCRNQCPKTVAYIEQYIP